MSPELPVKKTLSPLWPAAFLSWVVVLTWLSLSPTTPETDIALFDWDKLRHALAYALLVFLAIRAGQGFIVNERRLRVGAFLFACLYGGLLEVFQELLTDVRFAESGDLAANATGAAVALLAEEIRSRPRRFFRR
jgi:VanZ family protein